MNLPFKPVCAGLAALLLGACAASAPDRSAVPTAGSDAAQGRAATAPAPFNLPATGVVESASVASLPSASAGGSTAPTMAYRLRMDDGSTRSVLLPGERFQPGDRVEVTSDGRLLRR